MRIPSKENVLASGGSLSSSLSFLGSYQICHNICMSIIAILTGIGITVKGMPLLFLQKVAVYFWIAAVIILIMFITLLLQKKTCVSKNTIFFNSGLIIAGVPFKTVQDYSMFFWITGGTIVIISIMILYQQKSGGKKQYG